MCEEQGKDQGNSKGQRKAEDDKKGRKKLWKEGNRTIKVREGQ